MITCVLFVVSSENKRDLRTIEEILAENKARKKQKTCQEDTGVGDPASEAEKVNNGQHTHIS